MILLLETATGKQLIAPAGHRAMVLSVAFAPETVTEYRPEKRTVTVLVNGKQEPREVTVIVPVVKETLATMSLKGLKAYSGDGKAIEEKELWQRVKPGAVVVWGDQQLLQPPFDKAFRPEVVLLVSTAAPPPDAKN